MIPQSGLILLTLRYAAQTLLRLWYYKMVKMLRGALIALVLIPVLVLVGWATNNAYLTSIVPGITPMNPLSAISFILIGVALWCLAVHVRQAPLYVRIVSACVLFVGVVMLLKYLLHIDLKIDRLLFTAKLHTNRIAPNTAVCFVLVGIALLFAVDTGKRRRFTLVPVSIMAFLSLLSLLGYAYRLKLLFGIPGFTPMALHTAFCFLLVAFTLTSLMLARKKSLVGRKIWVSLGLTVIIVLGMGIISANTYQDAAKQQDHVTRTYQLIEALDDLNMYLVNAETGQRGYILTGNEAYLAPYNESSSKIKGHIAYLASLLNADGKDGTALTKPLAEQSSLKLAELQQTIALKRAGQSQQALAIVNSNMGKRYTDAIQATLDRIEESQLRELHSLEKTSDTHKQIALWITATATAVDAMLIIGAFLLIRQTLEQRKEAQDKVVEGLRILRIEKNKSEAFLQSIGDGVFAIDASNHIILFNTAAEQITGHTAAEAIGHPYDTILEFFNEKDGSKVDHFIRRALAGHKASMAEHTSLRNKDGKVIPVADSAAPITDGHGGVSGAVVVFRDVTRERELVRLKDDFVSIASHELRTPMGAIRAFTSMILAGDYGPVNKNLVEPLQDIRNSTLRLVNLVNDLLDVARIEAGRMKIEVADVDLKQLLKESAGALEPLAHEKGVKLRITTGKQIIVQADSGKVKQVVTNLVSNALKFTDAGSISIDTHVQNNAVEVTVTDTGLGISLKDQGRLFHKFEQITSTQEGRPAGTGLGLYISRQIMQKLGGDLYIKTSTPGKGSVFAFVLPLAGTPAAKKVAAALDREARIHPDQK
jgi:PAS domain S-box-containing protein